MVLLWGPAATVAAKSTPGTTSGQVLRIGVGARAMAMGEAYVAQADDASSLYWNPAGLALMPERQVSFQYTQLLQDLTYQNAALAIPLSNGALGGNVSYLNYGKIQGYDTGGNETGNLDAYSAVGSLGMAWLGNNWALGLTAKGLQDSFDGVKANGFAFDAGTSIIIPKPVLGGTVRAAAVVQNVGKGVSFINERDPLPTTLRVGVAGIRFLDDHLNWSLDVVKPVDDELSVQGGLEYWLGSFLALRAGYAGKQAEGLGLRAGVGLRIKKVAFDYAYGHFGDLGMTHRYELSMKFGEPRPILTAEEMQMYRQAKAALREGAYEQAVLLFNTLIEMEPRFRPAYKYMRLAMAKVEGRERYVAARTEGNYDVNSAKPKTKENLGDLDDIEQLLNTSPEATALLPEETLPTVESVKEEKVQQ